MLSHLRKKLALQVLCLISITLYAQENTYQFSQLDISKGLSHNRVTSFYKDHKGFMWFGTIAGLNRYDGYTFKIFTHDSQDTLSLIDNYVLKIFELPNDKMLIQTRSGNSVFNPATEKFYNGSTYLMSLGLPIGDVSSVTKTGTDYWLLYPNDGLYKLTWSGVVKISNVINNTSSIDAATVSDIKTDSKNNLVVVHRNGILEKINPLNNKVVFRTTAVSQVITGGWDFDAFVDKSDDIWLYNPTVPFGAVYYNSAADEAKRLTRENGILNNNIVNGVVQDNTGLVWIGTDHGGVNLVDKKNFHTTWLKNKENDAGTLSQNVITTIYKDNLGIIWLGTYKKGINYYHENITRFPVYRHQPGDNNSLSFDDVNRFVEDAKGNLWIGTNGGGLIYFDRKTNTFRQFKHDALNGNSVGNDVIIGLYIDHEQKLWIGSYYGGLDCYDGKQFIHYKHDDAVPTSLSEDRVWEIYEDKELNLWIGTFNGGIDRFDRKKNVFYHFKKGENSVSSNYSAAFVEDAVNNLWMANDAGIDVMNKATGKFIHYSTANGISNNDVISLLKDESNNIWIGTRNGLNVFNNNTGKFQSFFVQHGLPDNSVLNILEDNDKDLWISTPKGLAKIKVNNDGKNISINCKKYDELDGLQSRDFNENAAYKTSTGELIFGGANGFNIFSPAQIKENNHVPEIVFTDLELFNKPVAVGEEINRHIVLKESISEAKEITLRHNENVFAVNFAALSFDNTEKNMYAYKLDGFDKNWLTADAKSRKATYTNLDPGEYVFNVRASNDDGIWNNKGIQLKIKVLPPFWRTPVAYLLYFLIAAAVFLYARRIDMQRAKMRFALAHEREEAQRLHELDMMKIKFFTNVSHEFRTPLSLILTPVDKLLLSAHDTEQKKQFQLIHRNARRLLNLVNQLLDFRKMEVQELRLNPVQGDVLHFIKEVSYSFTDLAEKKNIQFFYTSNTERFITQFDHDKIERILFNLLSNAFKFTHEKGIISIEVNIIKNGNEHQLEIKVKDNGIGIDKDKQANIFEHFFQSDIPQTMLNQGSGIGLSITREFVKLHGGSIQVESEVNKGSCFTVLIPVTEVEEHSLVDAFTIQKELNGNNEIEVNAHEEQPALKVKTANGKKETILLVEDNEDFRFYLKDNLREFYHVIEAPNGRAGWQKVLSMHPDLVVSDISMPLMDGIELCKKIKKDQRTRQIPVILLTAMVGDDNHLKGLETGATDFMTKPFNFEIMLSRIRNILSEQKTLKKTLNKQVEVKPSETKVESADEKFIRGALEIIEKNLSNPDFSVEELSRELYMSRVAVYKRIFALTGKAPIDFIRSIRLQRAAQLLQDSNLTVAEVAYEVGFNNPKYFSKFFKAEFNQVPSAYTAERKRMTNDNDE